MGGKGQLERGRQKPGTAGCAGQNYRNWYRQKTRRNFLFPGDSIPLYIDKKSESLKLIQQARNEAHRFAINFHRNQRSRHFTTTELTQIPGIGEKNGPKATHTFWIGQKDKSSAVSRPGIGGRQ